jgi:hypothetical protein
MIELDFEEFDKDDIKGFVRRLLCQAFRYRSLEKTRISFPGCRSVYGEDYDSFSTMARILPIAAVWLYNGEFDAVISSGDISFDLRDFIGSALINGTDKNHQGYWGEMYDKVSRLVEINDIVWTLWLIKDNVYAGFSCEQKSQIMDWISQVYDKSLWKSNWQFTPVLVKILKSNFNYDDNFDISPHLKCLDNLYAGDGWYSDELGGETYDYYNAWQIHFSFLMICLIDDRNIIDLNVKENYKERAKLFLNHFPFFFGKNGSHVPFGRSLAYRMAVLGTMSLARLCECSPLDLSLEKRIVYGNIRFFLDNDILNEQGFLSCGFLKEPEKKFELYMFYGSPYWCSRGLLVLLYPENHPFWNAPVGKLPVEVADFRHKIESTGFLLCGNSRSGEVKLYNSKNYSAMQKKSEPFYSKYSYSTDFYFNYIHTIDGFPADSILYCMDEKDGRYIINGIECGFCSEKYLYRKMNQGPNKKDKKVTIRSVIIPYGDFSIRIHEIIPSIPVSVVEGTMAVCSSEWCVKMEGKYGFIRNDRQTVFIKSLFGYENLRINDSWGNIENINLASESNRFLTVETRIMNSNRFFTGTINFESNMPVDIGYLIENHPEVHFDRKSGDILIKENGEMILSIKFPDGNS